MKYLVTGQGYNKNDYNKQTEILFLKVEALDSQEAEVFFIESLWEDGYTFVKTISVVENEDE